MIVLYVHSLNSIGAGPARSIQPTVTAEIFFLRGRGKWKTVCWVVYRGLLIVAPIISSAMAAHVGWRNFWWLNVALTGLSLLVIAFMFPETKWHRLYPDETYQPSLASSTKQDASSPEEAPIGAAAPMQHLATATSEKPEDPLEATDTAARPGLERGLSIVPEVPRRRLPRR
jgi:MFS family permease